MHLEQHHVFFCRHRWRSLGCNSITKTIFLTSTSTSTSAFLTEMTPGTTWLVSVPTTDAPFPQQNSFRVLQNLAF